MKRILCTALSFSLFATTAAFASAGYITSSVNLRAGPDSSYPSVVRLRAGTSVEIQGCVDGWSWCDVSNGDQRGWVSANYIQEEYEGRRVLVPEYGVQIGIPIVSFTFGSYWDDHYRSRSWYGNRERWSHVRPQYEIHTGGRGNTHDDSHGNSRGDSHVGQAADIPAGGRQSRQAAPAVTQQPVNQGRRNAETPQPAPAAEVRSPQIRQTAPATGQPMYPNRANSPTVQHPVATETRSQENHASHGTVQAPNESAPRAVTPAPVAQHNVTQPRVIAEHKPAPAPPKAAPEKSSAEHDRDKDKDQH